VPPDPSAYKSRVLYAWAHTEIGRVLVASTWKRRLPSPRLSDRNPRAPPELGRRNEPDATLVQDRRALRPIPSRSRVRTRRPEAFRRPPRSARNGVPARGSGRSNGGSLTERREPTRRWRGRSGAARRSGRRRANGRIRAAARALPPHRCAGRLGGSPAVCTTNGGSSPSKGPAPTV